MSTLVRIILEAEAFSSRLAADDLRQRNQRSVPGGKQAVSADRPLPSAARVADWAIRPMKLDQFKQIDPVHRDPDRRPLVRSGEIPARLPKIS